MHAGFPVYANGRLHPPGEAVLPAEDQGFLLGLAVFDTLLYEDGCIYFVAEHLERFRRGAEAIGIPWPLPWDPAEALRTVAAALGGGPVALRLTATRGVPGGPPSLVVTPRAVEPPPTATRVWVGSHVIPHRDPLGAVKSTSRLRNILAREEAQRAGAWEALLANEDGELIEGTISNLFVVGPDAVRTPPLEEGCLSGIVREKVIASLRADPLEVAGRRLPMLEERVGAAQIAAAGEVFLTNSTGRIIPVVEVGGLEPPRTGLPGPGGPVARALADRLRAIEEVYREAERNGTPSRC